MLRKQVAKMTEVEIVGESSKTVDVQQKNEETSEVPAKKKRGRKSLNKTLVSWLYHSYSF